MAARYGVTDPGPLRQALPALPEGSRWVRDRDDARTLFEQHAGHIATTTRQREELRQLWNALINEMDNEGTFTVSELRLAAATGTWQPTVHNRIVALRDRGLLRLVEEAQGGRAARYGVTDPGPLRQASLPALPAGSRWVRDRNGARTLFNQHAGRIATKTRQRKELRQLWNALINEMDNEGIITASMPALADATGTSKSTVHRQIGALRNHRLLRLVEEAQGGRAARYGVTDPGQHRQAPVPGPAPGPDRPRRPARRAGRPRRRGDQPSQFPGPQSFPPGPGVQDSAPPLPMSGPVPAPSAGTGLPGLPGPVGDPDASTASSWLAGWAGPGWPNPGIDVTTWHGAGMSTGPGQQHIDNEPGDGGNPGAWPTWQVDPADPLDLFDPLDPAWGGLPMAVGTEPVPWPQPMDPSLPQALPDPTWWSQSSGDQPSQFPGTQSFPPGPGVQDPAPQSPMPGPVPAPPAGTGLPGLPGPLDDPDAPTASSWPAGWPGPAWPNPDIDVTAHGAGMFTGPGQQHIDNQPDDGGNLGDGATYQGTDMDWEPYPAPSPAVTRTDAGTLPAGDTLHHPADEPPTTPAPLHPDQPQPQPTAGSQWVRDRDGAWTLFNQHVGHITTTTQHREQPLRELWNVMINSMDGDGFITATERALAAATGTLQQTVHDRIVALRDRGLLWLDRGGHGRRAARYKVTDPGPPRQASLPALPEGRQWVLDRDDARTLFDQHVGQNATTTRQREQLRQLRLFWNALINSMNDDGLITVSESALAAATFTPRRTVRDRIGALRERGLLWLDQEKRGGVAAGYRVTDPGQPRQAPVPGPALGPDRPQGSEDLFWLYDGDTLPMSGPVPAPPAGMGLPGLPGPLDDPDASTASFWPAGPAALFWPEGWAEPAEPVPGSGVTDGHG
ncbi:hypothetical protein ACGFIZ_34125, partial [Micromonospora sp. NPDC048830]